MKRFNESEFVPSDLTPEEQLEKPRKLDKSQRDKIAEYKRLGGSYREIANYMGLSPSTVYRAWKNFPDPILPKDSPGPSKLGQAPVVPLDNNGKEEHDCRCHAISDRAEGAEWRTVQLSRISDGSTTLICGLSWFSRASRERLVFRRLR